MSMSLRLSIARSASLLAVLSIGTGAWRSAVHEHPRERASQARRDTVPQGVALVANQQSADASVVMLPTGTERRVPVGVGPHEAAIAPGGEWGVVTVYGTRDSVGTRLAVINLQTATLLRHVPLGTFTRPHAVVPLPGPGRRVALTSESTQNVVIVDLDAGLVEASIPTGASGSHMLAVTADGSRAFTANIPTGSVSELDLKTRTLVRTINVGQQVTEGIAVTPDGREVWVGSNASGLVSIVDTRTGTVVATVSGFRVPYRLAIDPDGRTAAVVDPQTGSLHFVDVASRQITGTVALAGSPRGVIFAPDGQSVMATVVSDAAVGSMLVVDVGTKRVVARFPVGAAPDGIAFASAAEARSSSTPPVTSDARVSRAQPVSSEVPKTGRAVLEQMHARYAGRWFHTLTFVQRTTRFRSDGSESIETWYESARAPDRLRIDIGAPALGNGVLSTPDSMYVVRGGTLVSSQAGGNELIPFVIGAYTQPVDSTLRQLAHAGFDYSRVRRDTWRDRPVWVVGGAGTNDSTSPQFWIDEERLILSRIILTAPSGAKEQVQDIRFDGYVPLGDSWLATDVTILIGGRRVMHEAYTAYRVDPLLPEALFDPKRWGSAPHWAAQAVSAPPDSFQR